MRFHSYLNSAGRILDEFGSQEAGLPGRQPFASFLKEFFSRHKKFGSRDRKQIAHLCYCFFRLGKSFPEIPFEERILIGLFLCSNESDEMLEQLKPEWNKHIDLPMRSKLVILNLPAGQTGHSLLTEDVFPWNEELSEGINYERFCESFFIQPDLFLRLRPGYEANVKGSLAEKKLDFEEITPTCLSLLNALKIEDIIRLDKEAVVQDYSSQRTGEFMQSAILNLKSEIKAWDCCAGSGGKSLLLYDINPTIDLTVSDIRESILINLKKRFGRAGIKKYKCFVADLTNNHQPPASHYDLIICDAPCTGSGTWSRTPEQLYLFDEKKIGQYALLQKKIVSNIIHCLKENGFLVYITCSVFKKENEEMVNYISDQFNLDLTRMELLSGYDKKADTLFVALFRKDL